MATPPIGNSPNIKRPGPGVYLKRAFLYRWNLLAFLGAAGAAVLSPFPDALMALVAAGELVYLTGLVSHPRFRDAVDAQYHQQTRSQAEVSGQRSVQQIVGQFPPEQRVRFEQLRARCLEMRSIAQGVRGKQEPDIEDPNTAALDRLLWVFLRLLLSQQAMARFLQRTDVRDIQARLDAAQQRAAQAGADERILHSLQDSVTVQQQRLENYNRARQNAEFVRVELDRIEAKIQAITEASVNRQDPNFLTSQIDSVTASMHSTEKAISELQEITGFVDEMQEPPVILGADFPQVRQQ
ncbi:MAG: hypothetical protein ABI806_11240 [Candidatus Solibacter sp.]